MANIITTQTIILSKDHFVLYVTCSSDGTQETNRILYSSSEIAREVGMPDTYTSTIQSLCFVTACKVKANIALYWSAKVPVLAFLLPVDTANCFDFKRLFSIPGLKNQGGTGRTGDIALTTTDLSKGDQFVIVMEINRSLNLIN